MLAAIAFLASFTINAQCVLTPTTLSTNVTDGRIQTIVVASATPNSTTACPTGTNFTAGGALYIDRELMFVARSYVSGTTIPVVRAQGGTFAAPHTSGAIVFSGQPNMFTARYKQGRCVRTSEVVLPLIDVPGGSIYDCLNNTWKGGDSGSGTGTSARFRIAGPESGGTAYTSLNVNGTSASATTLNCSETHIFTNKLVTGIALLNGTTVGTDKHYVVLYDVGGNLVANSAVAGATSSGASVFQEHDFTSKYFVVAGDYFACFQSNGATDTIRMVVTGTQSNLLTKAQTAATFGTIPALTVPTTFTTAVGPYTYIY